MLRLGGSGFDGYGIAHSTEGGHRVEGPDGGGGHTADGGGLRAVFVPRDLAYAVIHVNSQCVTYSITRAVGGTAAVVVHLPIRVELPTVLCHREIFGFIIHNERESK